MGRRLLHLHQLCEPTQLLRWNRVIHHHPLRYVSSEVQSLVLYLVFTLLR